MPPYNARISSLPPYPLAHIPRRKRELVARGVDLIDLGAGDAILAPPEAALDRMARAIREPAMGRYGFELGLMEYREAIVRFMKKRFGVSFDPLTEVVPLIGSKEGLAHVALAYLDHGDYAIMPEPGYNAYMGGTILSNGTPYRYELRADNDFLVDLEEVPDEVLAKTRILYLNYPGNPTAAIAPMDYLERVVQTCKQRDIVLVYDNAYSEVAYDGYVPPSIFEVPGARDVALEFHSVSKTFNMTGWRCGWACGNAELVHGLVTVKSFIDTGSFMAVQAAAAAALDVHDEFVPKNMAIFTERRDAAVDAFRENGFTCSVPKAAMYLWIPLPPHIASAMFAERLMEEGVIVMAGSAFGKGGEGFFRISFIASPERIREAARRAGKVLASFDDPVASA
ncbi:MAG: aminotransferase class I/II-fold pyridoxal phosphate-dependent enzyme [Gemmatimonadota bacterium]|nr:aminotransferase class I/II-fold pyridoxal phosphate-dependent enzyme [Gemmatimonadota bacterium]